MGKKGFLDHFYRDSRRKDNRRPECKECYEDKRRLFGDNSEHVSSKQKIGILTYLQLLLTHGTQCPMCGQEMTSLYCPENANASSAVTIDHKIPKSKDGPDEIWNLQLLCRKCNSIKNDKIITEFLPEFILNPKSCNYHDIRYQELIASYIAYDFVINHLN